MKKLNKLVIALLCMVMASFALTGCGSLPKTSSQIETSATDEIREQNIKDVADYTKKNFAAMLTSASYQQFKDYLDQGQVVVNYLFDNDFGYRWHQFVEKHGEIKKAEVKDTERTEEGYTSRIVLTGEDQGQMAMTISYGKALNPISTTIADYSDDSKETFAFKMETAAGNTATGLITVFIVLVFLIFVISAFNFLPHTTSGKKEGAKAAAPAAKKAAPQAAAAGTEGDDLLKNRELVAVIAAAIAASENKPVDGYVVRSIKRLHNNKWR